MLHNNYFEGHIPHKTIAARLYCVIPFLPKRTEISLWGATTNSLFLLTRYFDQFLLVFCSLFKNEHEGLLDTLLCLVKTEILSPSVRICHYFQVERDFSSRFPLFLFCHSSGPGKRAPCRRLILVFMVRLRESE